MAGFFLDSSALVKKYTRETGTSWILRLLRPSAGHTIFIVRVTPVETVAGLSRQNRIGSLTADDLDKAIRRIKREILGRFAIVEVTDGIVHDAIGFVRKYGLRGYDGIQLAAAVNVSSTSAAARLSPLIFVSADLNLNKAAVAESLAVENPNDH